jgi:hypothetical protein
LVTTTNPTRRWYAQYLIDQTETDSRRLKANAGMLDPLASAEFQISPETARQREIAALTKLTEAEEHIALLLENGAEWEAETSYMMPVIEKLFVQYLSVRETAKGLGNSASRDWQDDPALVELRRRHQAAEIPIRRWQQSVRSKRKSRRHRRQK